MTKRQIEIEPQCPEAIANAVHRVTKRMSPLQRRFLRQHLHKFVVSCSDDVPEEYSDGFDGKVFVNEGAGGEEFYVINIWPHMTEEPEDFLLYIVAHEFGHLFDLLAHNIAVDDRVNEARADAFARSLGFSRS